MKRQLREAHAHLFQYGRAMTMLGLGDVASVEECLERLASAARRASPGNWLLASDLRVESWREPRWPTADELERAAPGVPIAAWSFDYHALVASPAAMAAVGIHDTTPDPRNGRIVRDSATGRATGLMLELAAKMVWERVPEPDAAARRAMVKSAAQSLASMGFVEVHDLLSQPWLGPMLAEMHRAGDLPIRVRLYPPLDTLEAIAAQRSSWESDAIQLAGGKLFADGTLNARTAWMLHDYADPLPGMPRGQAMLSVEQIRAGAERAARLGLGLAIHAIGDGAVRAVLDGYEQFLAQPGAANHGLRVEHAELIDHIDVPRFAKLGVVCSAQPCHLLYDIEALERGLPTRLDRVLPLRELIDSGCRPGELLLFGSDVPIVRANPEDSIVAAVRRRRVPGAPGGQETFREIAGGQMIGEDEAWSAFSC